MSKFQFEYSSFHDLDFLLKSAVPDLGTENGVSLAGEQSNAESQNDDEEDAEFEDDGNDEAVEQDSYDDEWDDEEDEDDFEIEPHYPSRSARTRSHDDDDDSSRSKRRNPKRRGGHEDRWRRGRTWLDDDDT